MTEFRYVSLFSGIGGFEQALNKLGGRCVLASEIDKFANQAYEALYGHPTAGDITTISAKDVPDHDVLVGGFPCQAFSVAGKRGGMTYKCGSCGEELTLTFKQYIHEEFTCCCGGLLEPVDSRGILFNEIARIALSKQPRVLLLENVKGLVNHDKGQTLNVMIETLCEIGYTVDFTILNSKYFGVPQNRERIFIVAVRDDLVTQEPWIIEGKTIVPKGKERIQSLEGVKTFNFDWPVEGEVTVRLRDVLETQVDEKYYLSEEKTAVLVAQLEERGQEEPTVFDVSQMGHEGKPRMYQDVAPTITARDYKEPRMVGRIDINGHDAIKRVYSAEGVAPTLTTMGGGHREPKIAELQGLPIREATKQGYALAAVGDAVNFQFPDSKTRRGRVGKQIANTLEASSINQGVVEIVPKLSVIGNTNPSGKGMNGQVYEIDAGLAPTLTTNKGEGVKVFGEVRPVLTPDRAEKRQNGRRFKEDGEESFTLTAQDKHGVAIGVRPRYRIRKLTPLECWRLQGFTDEAHQTVADAGLSDSQRYKQAGNAVTVNVIEAIVGRLLTTLDSSV